MDKLFVAIFEDESIYNGGIDYSDTKWLGIPNKSIRTIFYRLPSGDHLVLSGYDKYFRMSEATKDLNGQNAGKVNIEFDYIMGKKNNLVTIYKINMKTENIEKLDYKEDDSFIKSLNKDNWR